MKPCDKCKADIAAATYTYPDGETTADLCPECAASAGFCIGCKSFEGGHESFEFSPVRGWCYECLQEIEAELKPGDSDYDAEY